jgi:hypothetical protein
LKWLAYLSQKDKIEDFSFEKGKELTPNMAALWPIDLMQEKGCAGVKTLVAASANTNNELNLSCILSIKFQSIFLSHLLLLKPYQGHEKE